MESIAFSQQPPLPTPNLVRLVQNILKIRERRKQQRQQLRSEQRASDGSLQPQSNSSERESQALPSPPTVPDNDDIIPRFKGKSPSEITISELITEFSALNITKQYREAVRREHEEVIQNNESSTMHWRRLQLGDSEMSSLAPSQMPLSPSTATLQSSPPGRVLRTPDSLTQVPRSDAELQEMTTSVPVRPVVTALRDMTVPAASVVPELAEMKTGRPLVKTGSPVHTVSTAQPCASMMWVRLPNNQVVLAPVSYVQQSITPQQQLQQQSPLTTSSLVYGPSSIGLSGTQNLGSGGDRGSPRQATHWAEMAAVSPAVQKQILGQRLLPLIHSTHPSLAAQITYKLLELETAQLQQLLHEPEMLKVKVEQCVTELQEGNQGTESLTPEMLAPYPAHVQREILGQRLLPVIQSTHPSMAYQIIGKLLELETDKVFQLLQSPDMLKERVEQAVSELQAGTQPVTADPSLVHTQQMLGQWLLTYTQSIYPSLARQITDRLLQLPAVPLQQLLQSPELLKNTVDQLAAELGTERVRTELLATSTVDTCQSHVQKETRQMPDSGADNTKKSPQWAQLAAISPAVQKQTRQIPDSGADNTKTSPQWAQLAAVSPAVQKQVLGQRLLPMIERMHPSLARQITGKLLELDTTELLRLLENPALLKDKVELALNALQANRPGTEVLTAGMLDLYPANMQREILGQHLLARIQPAYPDLAGKITGMLLELDKTEVLRLLNSNELLKDKVNMAICSLQEAQLAQYPLQEQKQMLGDSLFPAVQRLQPEKAGKITGMLLELDNHKLLSLLQSPEKLKGMMDEAVTVLDRAQTRRRLAEEGPSNIAETLRNNKREASDLSLQQKNSEKVTNLLDEKELVHTSSGGETTADLIHSRENIAASINPTTAVDSGDTCNTGDNQNAECAQGSQEMAETEIITVSTTADTNNSISTQASKDIEEPVGGGNDMHSMQGNGIPNPSPFAVLGKDSGVIGGANGMGRTQSDVRTTRTTGGAYVLRLAKTDDVIIDTATLSDELEDVRKDFDAVKTLAKETDAEVVDFRKENGPLVDLVGLKKDGDPSMDLMDFKKEGGSLVDLVNFGKEGGPSVDLMDFRKENGPSVDLRKEDGPLVDFRKEDGPLVDLRKEDGPLVDLTKDDGLLEDASRNGGFWEYFMKDDGLWVDITKADGLPTDVTKEGGLPAEVTKKEGLLVDVTKEDRLLVDVTKEGGLLDVRKEISVLKDVTKGEHILVGVTKKNDATINVTKEAGGVDTILGRSIQDKVQYEPFSLFPQKESSHVPSQAEAMQPWTLPQEDGAAAPQTEPSAEQHDLFAGIMAAASRVYDEKQMLKQMLYPLVQNMFPDLVDDILPKLLEMDNLTIYQMVESQEFLTECVLNVYSQLLPCDDTAIF